MQGPKKIILTALIALGWVVIWAIPWQGRFDGFIWLRLFVAMGIFIIPGAGLLGLLSKGAKNLPDYITYGFSISLIICGLLGLLARAFHLSFDTFKALFLTVGLVVLAFNSWSMLGRKTEANKGISSTHHFSILWAIFLLSVVLGALITTQRVLSDDDTIYLAYINNFQRANALDFQEVVFGYAFPSPARFWLMSIPISQALISDVSGIPAMILLSGYYEPFLVGLSIISQYRLARTLGLSTKSAALSGVVQITFLLLLSSYIHPGFPFFHQLSTDKSTAAFILTPIFIQSIFILSRWPIRQNIILCFLAGLSLSFAHPIILTYAVFVSIVIGYLTTTRKNLYPYTIRLAAILILIMLPQLVVRFSGGESTSHYESSQVLQTGDAGGMISTLGNSRFYGLNISTLGMTFPFQKMFFQDEPLLEYGWLVLPFLTAILSIKQIRSNNAFQYFFACFSLCLLTWFPFTGWLIGSLLTPWMLERAAWIFPFGISTVFLLVSLKDHFADWITKLRGLNIDPQPYATGAILSICLAVIVLYMLEHGLPNFDRLQQRTLRYQDLTEVGLFLDTRGSSYAIGSDDINDFLPAITVNAKPISYRLSDPTYSYFLDQDEHQERAKARQDILSDILEPIKRLELCEMYHVDYLIIKKDEYQNVNILLSVYPETFKKELQTKYYIVIGVNAF